MKTTKQTLLILVIAAVVLAEAPAHGQTRQKRKMTTDIPPGLYASPRSTLTGRDIETRFVRKSGQEQDWRNDGKKEITF